MTINYQEWDQQINNSADTGVNEKLYADMKSELKDRPSDPEVLWRMTKVCLILSVNVEDKNRQKELAYEALANGKKSCEIDPKCVSCHKWYCVALGRITKFCGVKDKIKFGHQFKQHLDVALGLEANDFLLHFMSGRFAYELSSLSWIERTIATTLFGSIPESSYDIALKEFFICDNLKPKWCDNYLWISKTFISMKDKTRAKDWVNRGLALDTKDRMDEMAHNGLTKLKNDHKL
jgi:hypothetical protein